VEYSSRLLVEVAEVLSRQPAKPAVFVINLVNKPRNIGIGMKFLHLVCTALVSLSTTFISDVSAKDALLTQGELVVTSDDLKFYVRERLGDQADLSKLDPARLEEAAFSIMTLKSLEASFAAHPVIEEEYLNWLAWNASIRAQMNVWLDRQVDQRMAETNWEPIALEYYLAHPEEYTSPETVDLRTLLLTTDGRTVEEAKKLASELAPKAIDAETFSEVILEHTEDEAAKAVKGEMYGVQRGQTVKPFEEVAFALTKPDEVSDPIVTRYGVHVIQLIAKHERVVYTFDEVSTAVTLKVKAQRRKQYETEVLRSARAKASQEVIINQKLFDQLVNSGASGPQD